MSRLRWFAATTLTEKEVAFLTHKFVPQNGQQLISTLMILSVLTQHPSWNRQSTDTHTVLFMISNTMKEIKYEKDLIKTIFLPFLKASNFQFLAVLFSWVLALTSPGIFNISLKLLFHNLRDLYVRNTFSVTTPFSNLFQ